MVDKIVFRNKSFIVHRQKEHDHLLVLNLIIEEISSIYFL